MKATDCIVTGGAGFIGCAISSGLVARYYRVVALDCLHKQIHPDQRRPARLHSAMELVQGDVGDPGAWDEILSRVRPSLIVHLAAETGTGQSLTEATRHGHTNVIGTTVMLDALHRHNALPDRMLLVSSRAVYGEGAWRAEDGALQYPGQRSRDQLAQHMWDFPGLAPLSARASKTRPAPVSVYGATKLAQEHVMMAWAAAMGVGLTILRLQNVYGPGQSLANPYTGIVSLFSRLARAGQRISLYEDGAMLRDFVLIDDVATAVLAAIDLPRAAPGPLDVGTGRAMKVSDVAARIAAIYNAPAPEVCSAFRYGDVRHAFCDIDETETALGWSPRHSLEVGLPRLVDWIETELGATSGR